MKRLFIGVLLMAVVLGCNVIEDMKDVFHKQELVIEAIKEEKGWESKVGFNIHNGVLTDVTVTLDAKEVNDQKVADLVKVVRPVVLESFDSTPQSIYIQIDVTN